MHPDTHATLGGATPGTLLATRAHAREKAAFGWIRIACFLSILFHHTIEVPYEFLEGRGLVVLLDTLRDFGVVGFFLIAGASLRAKVLADPRMRFSASALAKVCLAALALTAFEFAWSALRGLDQRPLRTAFYALLYESNLWFLLAYAFAGPLLLALDARAALLTFACGLVLVVFPGYTVQSSPYVLHSISLAFVCMYVGYRGFGWQLHPAAAAATALACLAARLWLDDVGMPAHPAADAMLRLVYGLAVFHLLKAVCDVLLARRRAPRLSNYLFVPYVVQYPQILLVGVALKNGLSLMLGTPGVLVFGDFGSAFGYMLLNFAVCAAVSFAIAALMRRHDVRL